MYFIYNILLFSVSFLAVPFILFAMLSTKKYRSGLSQKVGFVPDSILLKLAGERPVWIHAVSVGEVMTTIPLIRKLKKNILIRRLSSQRSPLPVTTQQP